jgi:type I restriction enzyme M protein
MPKLLKKSTENGRSSSRANLGFETTLWAIADKMRNNLDAAEYKHREKERNHPLDS